MIPGPLYISKIAELGIVVVGLATGTIGSACWPSCFHFVLLVQKVMLCCVQPTLSLRRLARWKPDLRREMFDGRIRISTLVPSSGLCIKEIHTVWLGCPVTIEEIQRNISRIIRCDMLKTKATNTSCRERLGNQHASELRNH
jgi:hypothetical protein